MGTIFKASSKSADAPDIEADIYDARFEGIETKFIEGGSYGDGDRYIWKFTLLDDDGAVLYDNGDPIEVDAMTSMSLNVNSKTVPKSVRFLKAIASDDEYEAFANGDGIDLDGFEGRKVQVDVYLRDSGWPSVASVLPKRKARRTQRLVTTEDDEG